MKLKLNQKEQEKKQLIRILNLMKFQKIIWEQDGQNMVRQMIEKLIH